MGRVWFAQVVPHLHRPVWQPAVPNGDGLQGISIRSLARITNHRHILSASSVYQIALHSFRPSTQFLIYSLLFSPPFLVFFPFSCFLWALLLSMPPPLLVGSLWALETFLGFFPLPPLDCYVSRAVFSCKDLSSQSAISAVCLRIVNPICPDRVTWSFVRAYGPELQTARYSCVIYRGVVSITVITSLLPPPRGRRRHRNCRPLQKTCFPNRTSAAGQRSLDRPAATGKPGAGFSPKAPRTTWQSFLVAKAGG